MVVNPLKQFGLRLVILRKKRGWSQEQLALESGLARSYVSGIERGMRNLALANICALAETLGVPPADLLDFRANDTPEAVAIQQGKLVYGEPANVVLNSVERSMTRMESPDQDLVAEVAKALARKRIG